MNTLTALKNYTFPLMLCCLLAFGLRALTFYFGIAPYHRFKQPDSVDYHNATLCVALGHGMTRPDSKEPIFWRTPGYPAYLAPFYNYCGIEKADFESNARAHTASIWLQIILSSLLPLLFFVLAFELTHIGLLAWIVALLGALHIGFVLASCYLLTDALAALLFTLFLIAWYRLLFARTQRIILTCIGAALALSVYTWMRPMGEVVAVVAALVWIAVMQQPRLSQRIYYAILFLLVFFATLSPWYVRNFQKTGSLFFCPTIGIYLNCFSVPKIMSRVEQVPLLDAFRKAQRNAAIITLQEKQLLKGPYKHLSPLVVKKCALPYIINYPWYFIYDWVQEVCKTTWDLYSYQLVAFVQDTFWYDPLQEFLTEKVAACLYKESIPIHMRIIAWLELIYSIFVWIGLIGGIWKFILCGWFQLKEKYLYQLWMATAIFCIGFVSMSGGFGYARLRMPIEPLFFIMALIFYYETWRKRAISPS